MVSEDDVREVIAEEDKPLKGGPGKAPRKPRKGGAAMRAAMVNVLGQASAALFTCVAMVTGHDYWSLEKEEASKLGEALDKALATLPERAYEKVIAVAEKWSPWVQLIFVLGVILWDRIEESTQRVEAENNQPNGRGAEATGAAQQSKTNGYRNAYHSSLGWNN